MTISFYDRHDRLVPARDLTWSSLETVAPGAPTPIVSPEPRMPRQALETIGLGPASLYAFTERMSNALPRRSAPGARPDPRRGRGGRRLVCGDRPRDPDLDDIEATCDPAAYVPMVRALIPDADVEAV